MSRKLIIILFILAFSLSTSSSSTAPIDSNVVPVSEPMIIPYVPKVIAPTGTINKPQIIQPEVRILSQPAPTDPIRVDASTQDYNTNYDQTVTISGTLADGVGNPWGLANVNLYLNDQTHIGGSIVETVQTTAQGTFSFVRTFLYTDIGVQTYEVYFPNDEADEFRLAGVVKTGSITLTDTVTPTIVSDKPTVGITQTFTITYTLKNGAGADVDPSSANGLQVQLTISSNSPNHINGQPENVTTVSFDAIGQAKYTYTAPFDTSDYLLTISADVTNTGGLPNVDFSNAPASTNVQVAAQIAFVYDMTIGGNPFNTATFYLRDNSLIQIDGSLQDPTTLLTISNIDYRISFTGGGANVVDIVGVTDINGNFTEIITLSTTNFDNPNTDILMKIDFFNSINVVPNPTTITIKLAGIYNNFVNIASTEANNGTHITTKMYWPAGDNTITVSGKLLDSNGKGVIGATVNFNLNTKTAPNNTWAGQTTVSTYTNITLGDGTFSRKITIPSLGSSYQWLTVNITIDASAKWTHPVTEVTTEVLSFMFFRSITVSAKENRLGSDTILTQNNIDAFNVFNDTLKTYFDGVAYYNITVTDEFGRAPLGVTFNGLLQVFNPSGVNQNEKTYSDSVTLANSGIFTVNFSDFKLMTETAVQLIADNANFKSVFSVGDGNTNIPSITFTESFTIFGPDDTAPEIQNVVVSGSSTGVEEPLSIVVNLNYAKSNLDNIRNVTLYYEYSDNLVADQADATFSSGYTVVSMTYNAPQQNYIYTFNFDGHGRWIRWYVVVYDLAGQGLNANGTTNPGYAGWDLSFSRMTTYGDMGSPQYSRMGDLEIASVDLANSVLINGIDLSSSINVTLNATIVVSFDIPLDLSGYDEMYIYIRILTHDPDNGSVISISSWVRLNMTYSLTFNELGTDYFRYTRLINTTELNMDWFTQLDYYFNYTDGAGNNLWTNALSAEVNNNVYKQTWVTDEVAPVSTPTNTTAIAEALDNSKNLDINTWLLQNQTNTITITYNVTDNFGSGLKHVNVTIWTYFLNETSGELVYTLYSTIIMVQDGNITYSYGGLQLDLVVGDWYEVIFDIPNAALVPGNNVTYEITVVDRANREITINDRDGTNPVRFEVAPPIIITTPNTSVLTTFTTTDENGNAITFTSAVPEVETGSNKLLMIIVGFIGGLTVLIVWYQRHNITEYFAKRRRRNLAESELKDLIGEIERLRAEGKYRRAILLTWEALERGARQIIQTPRRYNQTAKEFTEFLSTITIVERETLLTLSDVFEMARYGKGQPSTDELDDAVNALRITIDTIIQSGATMRFDDDDDF